MKMHINKRRVPRAAVKECLILLQKAQHKTHGARLSPEEETTKKWGKSPPLTVGASESMNEDGVPNDLAVGLEIVDSEAILKTSGVIVIDTAEIEKNEVGVDTHIQGTEDSTPRPHIEKEIPADEIEATSIVLLFVLGYLNGTYVKFLIDSEASECFVDTTFAEQNGLKLTKTKEKLKIHLADGTVRVSNWVVK